MFKHEKINNPPNNNTKIEKKKIKPGETDPRPQEGDGGQIPDGGGGARREARRDGEEHQRGAADPGPDGGRPRQSNRHGQRARRQRQHADEGQRGSLSSVVKKQKRDEIEF